MFKYEIKSNDQFIEIKITTALEKEKVIIYQKKSDKETPSKPWFTATSKMKDFIGNVKKLNTPKCEVEGYYEGGIRKVPAIIVVPEIKSIGDRVMCTEHVSIDGKLEFLATKKRILQSDLNFINIGWEENGQIKRYLRIDVYLGESKEMAV